MTKILACLLLFLADLASAFPQQGVEARQESSTVTSLSCAANNPISELSACISGGGRAAITSICRSLTSTSVTFDVIATPSTTTQTTTVATSFASTATRVSRDSTTTVTTTTYTSTVRTTSGTISSLAGIVTTGVISTTTRYTCPNSANSASFPTSTSASNGTSIFRRQTNANACLPVLRRKYGDDAFIAACSCLRPTSSIATTTVTLASTSFSGTVTVTASRTATARSTRTTTTTTITFTSVVSTDIETTTTVPETVSYVSTVTTTDISTVITAYPLPTALFRIFMVINGQKLYGRNVQAASNTTGIDVIALLPGRNRAASFELRSLNLILAGPQTKVAVEQTTWSVPFVYLVPTVSDSWTTPDFAACNATLEPTGEQSNYIFAACFAGNDVNRQLAFGSPGVWSGSANDDGDAAAALQNGTCIAGVVGIEAVSGSLTPTPSSTSTPSPTATPTDTLTGLPDDNTTTDTDTNTDQESTTSPSVATDVTTSALDTPSATDISPPETDPTTPTDRPTASISDLDPAGPMSISPMAPSLPRAPWIY